MSDVTMDKLMSLCKRRGFVFPGSEIYGGLANSWDYGPLGAQLKKNIKTDWWQKVVENRADMFGLDGAILMNPRVWEASGHVSTFNDPLVEDKVNHKRYRADHLIEEKLGVSTAGMSLADMAKLIEEKQLKSPDGNPLTEPKQFNMMFRTQIGAVNGEDVYLRPETAQAIFVNFKNVVETMRARLPFGIAQIGKAFRNEITPGNFIFRTLEFEQMEIEFFTEESEWQKHFEDWADFMEVWAYSIGIPKEKIIRHEIDAADLAHYSKRTIDFEFNYPFGTKELWGLAYRTDFDLKRHAEFSKQKMEYSDPNDNKRKIIPHVIEPSFGVDRTLLAVLLSAYNEEEVEGGEARVVMKFAPRIAPYHVAVLPLMKKDGLSEKAEIIFANLQKDFRAEFDDGGSIGKRYRRHDEIGTPLCITIDYDTLDDEAVTVRERDTMTQERIKISDLNEYINKKINS